MDKLLTFAKKDSVKIVIFAFCALLVSLVVTKLLSLLVDGPMDQAFTYIPAWITVIISAVQRLAVFFTVVFCLFLFFKESGIKNYFLICIKYWVVPVFAYFAVMFFDLFSSFVIMGWYDTHGHFCYGNCESMVALGYTAFALGGLFLQAIALLFIYFPMFISYVNKTGYFKGGSRLLRKYKFMLIRINIYIFAGILAVYFLDLYVINYFYGSCFGDILAFLLKVLSLLLVVCLPSRLLFSWVLQREERLKAS